jgi:hypothetical protein
MPQQISLLSSATFLFTVALTLCPENAHAAIGTEVLARQFAAPPDSARPEVIWYWRKELHTREGITADLEAMKRVGIGGVLIGFIGNHDGPKGDVTIMSDKWREMFAHAVSEAKRLGIRVNMFNSPGWSSSGGPWITPAMGMQTLVWSESRVTGGVKLKAPLPKPHLPPVNAPWCLTKEYLKLVKDNIYLGDVAVFAFPTPAAERAEVKPAVTYVPDSGCDLKPLLDGNIYTLATLPNSAPGTAQYVQFDYIEPTTIRSVSVVPRRHDASIVSVVLEHSSDRQNWVSAGTWKMRRYNALHKPIARTTAQYWRLGLVSNKPGPAQFTVGEISLNAGSRVEDWTAKAMFDHWGEHKPRFASNPGGRDDPTTVIQSGQILDLTDKLQGDGTLDWTTPPGDWTVMRIGRALTMAYNGPASPPGAGLDCDKLNPKAVELHWNSYIAPLLKDEAFDGGVQTIHIDSYEKHNQNWSPCLPGEFRERRGYDLRPWLPAMTGRIIDSTEVSERFLWDLRQTICDAMADNYYGRMAELCHEHGKQLSIEPYHQVAFDNVTVGGRADMVVTEFWQGSWPGPYWYKLGSSPAHVYGKRIVGAEAFTSNDKGGGNWSTDPWALKPLGDSAFCSGVNHFIFHVYTQQPWVDLAPGPTTGPFGSHFERNNTWFDLGYGWLKYMARCQYMLQQGQFVGDVLYSVGENTPNESTGIGGDLPRGYDYDHISPEAILTRLSAKDGRFALPDGISYAVLVLPPTDDFMTAPMARKLRELVQKGCTVVGPRPLRSPSLSSQPAEDETVKAIAAELWGTMDGETVTENTFGKGRVFWGRPLEDVLKAIGVVPDFSWKVVTGKIHLKHIHRQIGEGDLYFVSDNTWPNRDNSAGVATVECSFRGTGKVPELWDAVTGRIRPLPSFREANGTTTIPLQFEPRQSFFIVFREGEKGNTVAPRDAFPKAANVQTIAGPWQVSFDPRWFYPDTGSGGKLAFDKLQDWSQHVDPAVKYFSGTAEYRKQFDIENEAHLRRELLLDLGAVKNLAEVHVNGRNLGVVWCAPWRVAVPRGVLKPKENELVIKVSNLWPNRLIGDEQLPADCEWRKVGSFGGKQLVAWPKWLIEKTPRTSGRRTFSTWKHWSKDSPLLPSGLLGPVTVCAPE